MHVRARGNLGQRACRLKFRSRLRLTTLSLRNDNHPSVRK